MKLKLTLSMIAATAIALNANCNCQDDECVNNYATLDSVYPPFGSDELYPVDVEMVVEFETEMDPAATVIKAYNSAGEVALVSPTGEWGPSSIGEPNRILKINPATWWGLNETVQVELDAKTAAGCGLENRFSTIFETLPTCPPDGDEPRLVTTSLVLDLPTGTDQTTAEVIFDTEMNPETLTGENVWIQGPDGLTVEQIVVDGTSVFITIGNIAGNGSYIIVFGNDVTDLCTDPVDNAVVFLQIGVDDVLPTVIDAQFPPGSISCGESTTQVEITFSEPVVGMSTGSPGIQIDNGASVTVLSGSDAGPYVLQLNDLADGQVYAFTLTSDIRDLSGNSVSPNPWVRLVLVCSDECLLADYAEVERLSSTGAQCVPTGSAGNTNSATAEQVTQEIGFDWLEQDYLNIQGRLQLFDTGCLEYSDIFRLGIASKTQEYTLQITALIDGANAPSQAVTASGPSGGISVCILNAGFTEVECIDGIEIDPPGSVGSGNRSLIGGVHFVEGAEYYLKIEGLPDIAPPSEEYLEYCLTLSAVPFPAVTGCGESCAAPCKVADAEQVSGAPPSYRWRFLPGVFTANDKTSFGTCDTSTGYDGVVEYTKTSPASTYLVVKYDQSEYLTGLSSTYDPIVAVYDSCTSTTPIWCQAGTLTMENFLAVGPGTYYVWFGVEAFSTTAQFQGGEVSIREYTPGQGESCANPFPALTTGLNPIFGFSNFRSENPDCIAAGNLMWFEYTLTSQSATLTANAPGVMAVYESATGRRVECTTDASATGNSITLHGTAGEVFCIAFPFPGNTVSSLTIADPPVLGQVVYSWNAPTPAALPLVGLTTTCTVLTGYNTSFTVTETQTVLDMDVRVRLNNSHPYEIDANLQYDNGVGPVVCVPLTTDFGSTVYPAGMSRISYDDEATQMVNSSTFNTRPREGNFRPYGTAGLGFNDGNPMNGTYTLQISDDYAGIGVANIEGWDLYLSYGSLNPGEKCSNPHIPLTVGTNPIVQDSRFGFDRPSCFGPTEKVDFYTFTLTGGMDLLTIQTGAPGNVALIVGGTQIACLGDLSVAPADYWVGPDAEVCIAVGQGATVPSITVGMSTSPCVNGLTGTTTATWTPTITTMYWMIADDSPTGVIYYSNLSSVYRVSKTGGTTTTVLTSTALGYAAVMTSTGEIFGVDNVTGSNQVYRLFDGVTWAPTLWGTIPTTSTFYAMDVRGPDLVLMEYSTLSTRFWTVPVACGAPPCAGTQIGITSTNLRYGVDLAVDNSNYYVVGRDYSVSTTCSGILRWDPLTGTGVTLFPGSPCYSTLGNGLAAFDTDADGTANWLYHRYYSSGDLRYICNPSGTSYFTGTVSPVFGTDLVYDFASSEALNEVYVLDDSSPYEIRIAN
jgi:hypothetical protein